MSFDEEAYMNSPAAKAYSEAANKLVERIAASAAEHPEIYTMDNPRDMFKVPGLDFSDIGPTLYQASWALRKVQAMHRAKSIA